MTVSKNNSDFWYKEKNNKNFVKRLFQKHLEILKKDNLYLRKIVQSMQQKYLIY